MTAERIGLLDRRRLGLTIPALIPVVKELQAAGALIGDPPADAAAAARYLFARNEQVYRDVAGRDWQAFFEALLNFLEKAIPLILHLIALFGERTAP